LRFRTGASSERPLRSEGDVCARSRTVVFDLEDRRLSMARPARKSCVSTERRRGQGPQPRSGRREATRPWRCRAQRHAVSRDGRTSAPWRAGNQECVCDTTRVNTAFWSDLHRAQLAALRRATHPSRRRRAVVWTTHAIGRGAIPRPPTRGRSHHGFSVHPWRRGVL